MSTSPEAKQAAVPIAREICLMLGKAVERNTVAKDGYFQGVSVGDVADVIAKGYDAATAKLREELAKQVEALAQARAPLVAVLEELVRQFEKVDKLYSKDREVIARARAALTGTGPQMCIIPGHPDNCMIHGKRKEDERQGR